MASLNETERSLVRRFLGFQNWRDLALMWSIPFPTHIEPNWYINDAIDRLTDEGNELVRRDLCELQDIESQMSCARKRLAASKVGDITLNPDELETLRGEYEHWKNQLADDFGTCLNPLRRNTGGTRNGTVIG